MIDKIKNIFNHKEKRIENLFFFLIILVITLIVINKILDNEEKVDYENQIGVELANNSEVEYRDDLEKKLENILLILSIVVLDDCLQFLWSKRYLLKSSVLMLYTCFLIFNNIFSRVDL